MKYVIKSTNLKWLNDWCTAFLNDAKCTLDKDGWHVCQTELAKVGLLEVNLCDMAVENLQENIVLAWDTDNMKDFLADLGDCEMSAIYKEGRLFFEVEDLEREMTTVDGSNITIARKPKLDGIIKAKFPIELAKLKRAIKVASKLSDHAKFRCEDNMFYIAAQKETGDKVTLKHKLSKPVEGCSSDFSLNYLERVTKQLKGDADGKITIEMGTDCPVVFHDYITEKSNATFYLAPRVESE